MEYEDKIKEFEEELKKTKDELVYIQIADNDQIAHIIELVRMRLSEKNEYTVEKHKEIVIQELLERGFDQSVIDEWTQYIE